MPEPSKGLWRAYQQDELESIAIAQRQHRIRNDLSPKSIQQLLRALVEWSLDDAEFGKQAQEGELRAAIAWELLCASANINASDSTSAPTCAKGQP